MMSRLSSRVEMGEEKAWRAPEARLQLLQRAAASAGRAVMQLVKPWRNSHGVNTGGGTTSSDEPPSPMMSMLSSGIETRKEEARQLLRRASSRFNGLLSGYRSLSVHSDDFDRHEYGKMLGPLLTLWLHLYRCAGQLHRKTSRAVCQEEVLPLMDAKRGYPR